MPLNPQQKKAVEYLEGPLLVLAGPGTGKTQLLSEKVAYILDHTDTDASNILCLTFTETGAKNMRERLKTIIGQDALRVNIGTYHAFGQEILAQYKGYAEDYDRRLDAAIDEVRQYKIVKELQEALPGTDILRGDALKDIISVMMDAKGAGLAAEDLAQVARQNAEDSEVLSAAIAPFLAKITPRKFHPTFEDAYAPIYEILQAHDSDPPIVKRVERTIAGMARDLKEAIIEAEGSEKIKPLSSWKDKFFEKDDKGQFRLKDRVANKKLASVARLMRQYEEHLRREGLFDFSDMIEEALRVLTQDAGFRMSLQEKYQFIMLDEFQDTNPAQFAIVKVLTDYERPLVMAVGDDDQAIYEFQGALASNLADFQEHYGAEVVALTENYRSTQEILDFSRRVILQAPDRFGDKILTAHRADPPESQIYRYEFAGAEAECAWVARQVHELAVAGVPQSEIAVISYKRKYFEPLLPYLKRYPEIKIAYEKRDDLLADEQIHQVVAIATYVTEVAAEKRPSVQLLEILTYPCWGVPAVEVIKLAGQARREQVKMADYLAENGSKKLKVAMECLANLVARSFTEPMKALVLEIARLVEAGCPSSGSTPAGGEHTFSSRLSATTGAELSDGPRDDGATKRAKCYLARISERGSSVSRSADGREEACLELDGMLASGQVQFYENLASLIGKVEQHCGEGRLGLKDLVETVKDYEAAGMMMTATSPYKEGAEAVQILTAHRAKGLEFSHVFIISADHTAWGKGKGNNNLLALPKNLMQIRHTGTTDGERLRILYVALTRAKEALYITNALRDYNGKAPERLEYLDEHVEKLEDGTEVVVSPLTPRGEVTCLYEQPEAEVEAENLANWLSVYEADQADLREIYRERAGRLRWSASALTSFVDVAYAGPETFFRDYILQLPREEESEALVYGTLVHRVLEAVTKEGLSPEAAAERFAAELEKCGATEAVRRVLAERGARDIAKVVGQFSPVLHEGLAEVDFSAEHLVVAGVPVTGKIDHLVINEAAGTAEIYDFKTGKYKAGKWESDLSLYKYALQLEFYRMLMGASRKFAKYRVERAHVLFVAPDGDGEVHEKEYEFGEAGLVRELLTAVHRQVEGLKFLDDPELMGAKGGGLKEVKEFVQKLVED